MVQPVGTTAVRCVMEKEHTNPIFPRDDLAQQVGWGHSPSLLVPAPIPGFQQLPHGPN